MNDAVYNEYVNICEVSSDNFIWYEPLEHNPIIEGTLRGTIYLPDNELINFREMEDHGIRVDSGKVLFALFWINSSITMRWEDPPGEHYLCVSYEIGHKEEKLSVCWQKEGF